MAVLPFVITYPYDTPNHAIPTEHALGRDVVRKSFRDALAPLGYEDIALARIDEAITAKWGSLDEGVWRTASALELGRALDADALVYGDIARIAHTTTPLYTDTHVDITLRMVDARSGEELWRKHVAAAERGGALMQKGQLVDFVQDQIRSQDAALMFQRVSSMAAARAMHDFPNPPLAAFGPASTRTAVPRASTSGMKRLAILPLNVSRASWKKPAELLRRDLAAQLQDGPFEVLELQPIDAALAARGWAEGQPLPTNLPLGELAREMGADVVLRGALTHWDRTYLGLESWVTVGLQLELVDASTGAALWSEEHNNRRQAGILKGPTGYTSLATAPVMGMRTSHLERVGDDLVCTLCEHLRESQAPADLQP